MMVSYDIYTCNHQTTYIPTCLLVVFITRIGLSIPIANVFLDSVVPRGYFYWGFAWHVALVKLLCTNRGNNVFLAVKKLF